MKTFIYTLELQELVEDILKSKIYLYSLGELQHDEFLDKRKSYLLRNSLRLLNYDQLRLIKQGYETQITAKMHEKYAAHQKETEK